MSTESRWRKHGIRIVHANELDANTAQTLGMNRCAAITSARTGARQLWAGTVDIHANARTGAHHHGAIESVIYVVRGVARMRWGEQLEFVAEAAAGDFIYVPPYVPHQEINANADADLSCVLVRSGQDNVVVNLDIAAVETPQLVKWLDDLHRGRHAGSATQDAAACHADQRGAWWRRRRRSTRERLENWNPPVQ